MARKVDVVRKNDKRTMILDKARDIFCEYGFLTVTMQQIATACNISRGGLYLFFSSVEEIFQAVITSRNMSRLEEVRRLLEQDEEFFTIVEIYLTRQKERLLSMENSILMATYEYYSVHQEPEGIAFRNEQVATIQKTISDVLLLGVKQNIIEKKHVENIAKHFTYVIEGLSVFAMFGNLQEEEIDSQFAILKSLVKGV